MPFIGPQMWFKRPFSRNVPTPDREENRALNRRYEAVLFRPIAEIRPIWACFETEADVGPD